jgi:hypothetical protein
MFLWLNIRVFVVVMILILTMLFGIDSTSTIYKNTTFRLIYGGISLLIGAWFISKLIRDFILHKIQLTKNVLGDFLIIDHKTVIYGSALNIPIHSLSHKFQAIYHGMNTGYWKEVYDNTVFIIERNEDFCIIRHTTLENKFNEYENVLIKFASKNLPIAIKHHNTFVWKSEVFSNNFISEVHDLHDYFSVLSQSKETIFLQLADWLDIGIVIADCNLKVIYFNKYTKKIKDIEIGDHILTVVDSKYLGFLVKNRISNTFFVKLGLSFKVTVTIVNQFTCLMITPANEFDKVNSDQNSILVGEFAGAFLHDLVNMFQLTGIVLGNIIDRHNFGPMSASFIEISRVRKIMEKMKNMADRMLSLQRGHSSLGDSLEVTRVIEDWAAIFNKSNSEINVKFTKDMDEAHVKINEVAFSQIIANITKNAIDAMKCGDILIHASIVNVANSISENGYFLMAGNNIKIVIQDQGPGIAQYVIDRILNGIHDLSLKSGGHGMGLRIVSALIKESNGFLEIQSHINKGSSFVIYLPIAEEHSTSEVNERINNINLLVIEDESIIRHEIIKWLVESGYNVFAAESVDEFYNILSTVNIQVVLLDANINNTNISHIIDQFAGTHMKFIIISAGVTHIKNRDAVMCPKPLKREILLKVVRCVIDQIHNPNNDDGSKC